jgi:pimeloyl-ACP methyl ester carboxylesterase
MIAGPRGSIGLYEVGDADAAPVLVLHGFPDHAEGMRTIADAIAAGGGRAIVPALPGYLPSVTPADGDLAVAAVARDLVSLLDALRVEQAAVVGHDWGAILAYQLGAHHAERLQRIVAVSAPHPVGFGVRRRIVREQQTAAYAWILAYARTGAELAADPAWLTQLAQSWSPGLRRDDWDGVLALLAQPPVAAAVCRWYRCDLDGDEPASEVLVAATVIHGAQDGCIGPANYPAADAWFRAGMTRIMLAEAGHWPHLERPGQVLPMILDGLGLRAAPHPVDTGGGAVSMTRVPAPGGSST